MTNLCAFMRYDNAALHGQLFNFSVKNVKLIFTSRVKIKLAYRSIENNGRKCSAQ